MELIKNSSKNSRGILYYSSEVIKTILTYLTLVLISLLVVTPILWIIGSAFNDSASLIGANLLPKDPSLNNFKALFNSNEFHFGQWYFNTFKIAVINMCLSVLLTLLSSYVFSRFSFRGKKTGLITMLVLQMFPSFMSMIAIFNILNQMNLVNSHLGLILTYAAGQIPYNTWLVKGFMQNIPRSLDEAAKLDGASNARIFSSVIVPLSKPILTFVALSQFMAPWMDFILPNLLLRNDDKRTLAIGLFAMVTGNTNENFGMFAAGCLLVALPITILYVCLQKYLIEGIMAGANKA
jgi:arabinogalactan oligomer/maltooligosaccharide transport system permease protein